MLGKRSKLFGLLVAAAVLGLPLAATPASADVLVVSDVAAGVSAPPSANGVFTGVGTITNTGNINQPAGSRLSYSASNGTVTSAPAGCTIASGVATCTVGALSPGQAASLSFGVTPNAGAQSVASTVNVTAAVLEQNVLDPTNNTATTATAVAYAVDAALSNNPTQVRFDDDTLLTSTVTNTKAPQTVNVNLSTGGQVDTRIAVPAGCSVTNGGADLSCAFALATGQSKSFDTAVTTPTTGSSMTSTLTATGASGGSKSVNVVTQLFTDAQAFVPAGDHLTFQGSNQFTDFSVPVGSAPGTFLTLHEVTLNNVACGTGTCIKQAAEAIFPSSGTYSGNDVTKPFLWTIKYNERQVCNGVGGGSGCLIDLYWIPTGGTTTQKMPLCSTYGTTLSPVLTDINVPCLQKVDKGTKGFSTYLVAVLRDIVIPIVSGSAK